MDPEPGDADRAQWELARRVREQRDAEAERVRVEREAAGRAATASAPRSHRGLVIGLALALAVALGTAGVLASIRRSSSQEPAWVRQLGLQSPQAAGGTAPVHFGVASTSVSDSTSPGTSTTGEVSARRPSIDTTGDDFDHIWRQIEVLEDWLLLHPDPSAVSEIYVPHTDPSNQLVALLTQLAHEHHTLDVQGYRIIGVTVQSRPSPDLVVVRYADTYHDRIELDAAGHAVSSAPYDGRARLWSLTLQRGADGRWRVDATSFIGYGDVVPSS